MSNKEKDKDNPQEELVKRILASVEDLSEHDLNKFKSFVSLKEIIAALVFLSSLIGGGYVAYEELKAKPSKEDVAKAIENRVAPLEEAVAKSRNLVDSLVTKVDRMELAMDLILDELSYQSSLLACQADKCKNPPIKPSTIESKRRKLLLGKGLED